MIFHARRGALVRFAAVAAMLGAFLCDPSPTFAANAAESFAQTNIDKGYTILNSSVAEMQRREQFRTFILGLTDLKRIAMFTLGPYARDAAPTDLDGFVQAFRDYAVAVYEVRLSKYKGQVMRVTGSTERAPDDVIVNAQVVGGQGGQPINAAFRVRTDTAGKLIVTDIQVEGVWLAINQRDEFSAYLHQNGGSIPKLSTHLAALTATLRANAGQ